MDSKFRKAHSLSIPYYHIFSVMEYRLCIDFVPFIRSLIMPQIDFLNVFLQNPREY